MEKEALYALPVYGDILADSILQLARKNPGIAVADVERNLCGLKTKKGNKKCILQREVPTTAMS